MVRCPIVNDGIDEGLCTTIVDVVDGCVKKSVLSESITGVDNWQDICKSCPHHSSQD